ncbi:carbohydrate-binding module family 18 protein [Piromyces sp. E2]|nr:carbohydrate-binding module family 18 protein [Piromyces sp. E2]|eukprot:OUM58892.1 carbohydrate-binding module family 18 protein [Piromyces sp. E2]
MKVLILTYLIIFLLLEFTLARRCGSEFSNKKCLNNECCSKWGYCGTSKDHCKAGCQSKYAKSTTKSTGKINTSTKSKTTSTIKQKESSSKSNYCGPKYNNKKCSFGDCCSKDGKCGFGHEYCGDGCQSEFGVCLGELPDPNPQFPEDEPSEIHCGPKYGYKKCSFGDCCSKDGECGFGHKYCGNGCQPEYGGCL